MSDPGGGGGGMSAAEMLARGVGNAAPDKDAKPADLSDFINQLLDKTGAWVSKFSGVNVNSMFKTGLGAHVDIQQGAIKTSNMINMGVPDSRGGMLADLVFGQVLNQSGATVNNLAGDIGGNAHGDGGSAFAGGGGGGGFDGGGLEIGPLPTGSARFEHADMPMGMAMLGDMSSPITPSTGQSSSTSMGMA